MSESLMSKHPKPWNGYTGINSPRYVLTALHPVSGALFTTSVPTLDEARQWADAHRTNGYAVDATYMDPSTIRNADHEIDAPGGKSHV